MAGTAADAALSLAPIRGRDRADPASVAGPAPAASPDALERGVRGLRIGYVRHFHENDMPAEPQVAAALDQVAAAFAAEGAEIRTVTLPDLNAFASVNRILLQSEAWAIHAPWLRSRPQDYGRLARGRLIGGAFLSAEDYVLAQRRRTGMIEAVETVF